MRIFFIVEKMRRTKGRNTKSLYKILNFRERLGESGFLLKSFDSIPLSWYIEIKARVYFCTETLLLGLP